jgi:hypothetical protein
LARLEAESSAFAGLSSTSNVSDFAVKLQDWLYTCSWCTGNLSYCRRYYTRGATNFAGIHHLGSSNFRGWENGPRGLDSDILCDYAFTKRLKSEDFPYVVGICIRVKTALRTRCRTFLGDFPDFFAKR